VSKVCLTQFVESRLHSYLVACLPRLLHFEASNPIVSVLDALTIIWKRLS
jgi:hypothetical protein